MQIKFYLSELYNSIKNTKKENMYFSFFIIFYLLYPIFLCTKMDMSYDEPYSLYTSANLSKVIGLSYQFEWQPPGYFLILSLWRIINDGVFFARLLSLIFTLLSAFFLYKVIRLIFEGIYTKWIVVIFLLNPFTVYSSTEIRLYSLIILLTILSVYLFYLIYFLNRNNFKIIFIFLATLGIYTQYFFVLLIISFAIVLFVTREWGKFFNFILLSFIVALLFIPNLFFIKEQFAAVPNTLVEYSFYDRIKSLIVSSSEFFVVNQGFYFGRFGRWIGRIVFVSIFIITLYKFYVKSKTEEWQDFKYYRLALMQMIFLLTIFVTFFSFTNIVYATRYMAILFPFHIILLAVFGIYNTRTKNIIYSVYAALLLLNLTMDFKPPYTKSYDFKSIAGYTRQIQFDDEPILFVNNDLTLGLKHIFESDKTFISLPEFKFDYSLYTNYVKDTTELNQLIKNVKSDSPSYLIVTGTELGYLRNKDLTNSMIDNYLINNYTIPIDSTFEGFYKEDYVRIRRIIKRYK
jgi:hypothetical protein